MVTSTLDTPKSCFCKRNTYHSRGWFLPTLCPPIFAFGESIWKALWNPATSATLECFMANLTLILKLFQCQGGLKGNSFCRSLKYTHFSAKWRPPKIPGLIIILMFASHVFAMCIDVCVLFSLGGRESKMHLITSKNKIIFTDHIYYMWLKYLYLCTFVGNCEPHSHFNLK